MALLPQAVVVGGGIGGLAAALGLLGSGRFQRIQVLERAGQFTELGAGLQVGPNAVGALRTLGVHQALPEYAFYPRRLVMLDALTGQPITALELGGAFLQRFGAQYVVMHRSDLLAMLLTEASRHDRIELRAGTAATGVSHTNDGSVVHTADGQDYPGELVIGADGLHSVLRAQLVADGPPVRSRYVTYRGTLPFDQVASLAGGEDVLLWAGPRMHLVQYPIRRGELYNQVVCFESDQFRADHDDWGTPEELELRFAEACAPVRAGAALIERGRRWQMIDRAPVPRWVYGRTALLGDAAHPMLQYLAQGACQALEDAACLGTALCNEPDLDRALATYQRIRQPRTARVQRTARQFGELIHLSGMGATVRDRLLGGRAHDDYSELDWLYRTG